MKTLDREPDAWARLHKTSQREMLRAEQRSLANLRKRARDVHTYALAGLIGVTDQGSALFAVRGASKNMAQAVSTGVSESRADARRVALARIAAEIDLIASLVDGDVPPVPPATDAAEDGAIADALGNSFSATWAAAMLGVVMRWADNVQDDTLALQARTVLAQLDVRLQRIAATEVSRAYNDEHDELAEDFAEDAKDSSWLPGLLKRWDATLDKRTCERCRRHDGEIVLVGFNFDGGEEPGELHAGCRCQDSMLFIPVPIPAAA